MAVPKALQRLLRIRDLQEEQRRAALESALGNFHTLEHARQAASAKEREGRALVNASMRSGEVADRLAGHVQEKFARGIGRMLEPHIAQAERESVRLRQEFLDKRIERRQAETMIENSEAQETLETGRRGQQSLDDWYGARKHRLETARESVSAARLQSTKDEQSQ